MTKCMVKKCYKHLKIMIFFQNFDFLMYFWHKDLFSVFMPKVPQKLKILKNIFFSIFQNLKIHLFFFINVDRWLSTLTALHFSWSTSTVDSVDVYFYCCFHHAPLLWSSFYSMHFTCVGGCAQHTMAVQFWILGDAKSTPCQSSGLHVANIRFWRKVPTIASYYRENVGQRNKRGCF